MASLPRNARSQGAATAVAVPTAWRPERRWLQSAPLDLGGILLPWLPLAFLFWAARGTLWGDTFALYAWAVGAAAHHVPGMLRAYGDRGLWQAYRTRLVAAPVLFAVAAFALARWQADGLTLMLALWGLWHGAMQAFGTGRLYARMAGEGAEGARREWAFVITGFVAGFVASDNRLAALLMPIFALSQWAGDAAALGIVRHGAFGAFAASYAVFLHGQWRSARAGTPLNAGKLLALHGAVAAWWFAMVALDHPVASLALFELFHDIQYVSIARMVDAKRAATPGALRPWAARLAGKGWGKALAYGLILLAYGACNTVTQHAASAAVQQAFLVLYATSAFLHFYLDGFIWRQPAAAAERPSPLRHAKALLFAVPALLFPLAPAATPGLAPSQAQTLAQATPAFPYGRLAWGQALREAGDAARAIPELRAAIALNPYGSDAPYELGLALEAQGQTREARQAFTQVLAQDPQHDGAFFALMRLGATP